MPFEDAADCLSRRLDESDQLDLANAYLRRRLAARLSSALRNHSGPLGPTAGFLPNAAIWQIQNG